MLTPTHDMAEAVVPDETSSPRRSSILDEGDIFSHSASHVSSPFSQDSSKLLERSTSLLDQIRSRKASRKELVATSVKMTTNDTQILGEAYSSAAHFDDNPDADEFGASFKSTRKPIEINGPEITQPTYQPSSNLERVRELMRGRQSAHGAEMEKTPTTVPSRSSRVKMLYGTRTESDVGRPSGSRTERLRGLSSESGRGRSRFDAPATSDASVASKRESLLSDLAKKRESLLSSLDKADFRVDKTDYMSGQCSTTNGINDKKDSDIIGNGMEHFRDRERSRKLASVIQNDAVTVNGREHMKSIGDYSSDNIDIEQVNLVDTTQTFSGKCRLDEDSMRNGSGLDKAKEDTCLIKGKDDKCLIKGKDDTCFVKSDASDDSGSDEAIETSEEVMFVVQENGKFIYQPISAEENNDRQVGQDQFNDMPDLEEDSSWKTNLESVKTTENFVKKPCLSKKYSFDENALSPNSNRSNAKSLENSEFWIKLEEEKSKACYKHDKNAYLSDISANDAVSSISSEFDLEKHEEFDDAAVMNRVEQIKHDLQRKRESDKESDQMYASIISEERNMSPAGTMVNNWVDTGVTDNMTVVEGEKTETACSSGVKLIENDVQLNNGIVEDLETLESGSQSMVLEDNVLKSGSSDGECVEFVKNISCSPIVVFTHPMNGDALGSATVPKQQGSPDTQTKSKPLTPKNRTLYKEPLKIQEVMIVPKTKNIGIPEPFRRDSINDKSKVTTKSPVKKVESKEAKPIVATKTGSKEREVIKISTQKSVVGTDSKAVAKTKEPVVKKVSAQKSLDYKHVTDPKPDIQIKEHLSRKISPTISNNNRVTESEVDATSTEKPQEKTKKFKRPSVKAAIRKWEQKKNNKDSKYKSMTELNQESETTKSFFERLSQPKSAYEGPPLVRQLSEIHAATEKTTAVTVGAQPPVSHIDEVKVTGARVQGDQDGDELVQPRVHMTEWDPVKLLKSLYAVRLMEETEQDLSHEMITMEGFMEKLPMGKKKSTLLKTWKRRYFKSCDGMLHYYESSKGGQPSMSIKLMGGSIESLDSRILGIDDSSGHYLMLRCPTDREFADWKRALESQTLDNSKAIYIRPVLNSPPHQSKRVVIVDIGSCSIRAGILGEQESLPSVFFPTVVAINKTSGARVAGFEAYRPDVRRESDLVFPVRPSNNTDKFNIDVDCLPVIFSKIFADLNIDPSQYSLLLSTPQNFSNAIKEKVIDLLVRLHGVPAVCMVPQALLAIYSYKATSGIIVDVGERLEIMAISEGYVVEGGVTRKAFGSQKACDSLKAALSEGRYHFFTPVEELLTRHVLEQSCYVASNYGAESQACLHDWQKYEKVVNLSQFDLPPDSYKEVRHAHSTFGACEGFFNTSLWGADFPTLQQLVHHAIQACPMDTRRDMARSIYLSGGGTVAPGFAERLTRELTALVPAGLKIIVHAAPQRYHAAYIGACTLANQKFFEPSCITKDEWLANGAQTLRKWATPH